MNKYGEPVRLRKRLTPSGRTSLYLDIYQNGRRTYEYLRLYLVPETTRADREKNRQTMRLAEDVRAKRLLEMRDRAFGFGFGGAASGLTLFYDYFRKMMEERKKPGKEPDHVWKSALACLKAYDGNERLTFQRVTREWVRGFRSFLETRAVKSGFGKRTEDVTRRLAPNTQALYFSKLAACVHQAMKEGIITDDPVAAVGSPRGAETRREFLTLDELRRLSALPHERPVWKRAFLFSCMTGLRFSDVKALTWGEVAEAEGFTRITFNQRKTGGLEYLDITEQAARLMGERGPAGGAVFPDMPGVAAVCEGLRRWTARAGIEKHITFHSARHTFAVMMLDLGADIYTVSKLLGHRELATTQVYAKVLDKNKRRAVGLIPDILGEQGRE